MAHLGAERWLSFHCQFRGVGAFGPADVAATPMREARTADLVRVDVSVQFHRAPPYSEWLLADTSAEVAAEGVIGFANRVFDERGRLIASGGGQMLCRRRP